MSLKEYKKEILSPLGKMLKDMLYLTIDYKQYTLLGKFFIYPFKLLIGSWCAPFVIVACLFFLFFATLVLAIVESNDFFEGVRERTRNLFYKK